MTTIGISTTTGPDGEYAMAIAAAGARPKLFRLELESLDRQLNDVSGILLSGGGDVDPQHYGVVTDLAAEIEAERDAFELALAQRARERGLPTLCICRGLQVANVAFGGTLVPDIGYVHGASSAQLHRVERDGQSVRGIIAGHALSVEPDSLLAAILPASTVGTGITTGSRHHQSLATVAGDLRVVATAPDGIIEAAEARFASPFWLGVQWHPESTLAQDNGASRAIFAAFVAAADRFPVPHGDE